MDFDLHEWLNLIVRWVHVFAGTVSCFWYAPLSFRVRVRTRCVTAP